MPTLRATAHPSSSWAKSGRSLPWSPTGPWATALHTRARPCSCTSSAAPPYSGDWRTMLRRIIGEIGRRAGFEEEVSDAPDQRRIVFARHLRMAAARGRVIPALDRPLDQLGDHDGAPDLACCRPLLSANVRLVVSTLPGRPLAEVEKRGWPMLRVQPLTVDERRTLIRRHLREHAKSLGQEHVDRIASAPQSANPLYLRALLEELRLWGVHGTPARKIDDCLRATTIDALSEQILARYEADYERDRPGLVRDAMTLIWGGKAWALGGRAPRSPRFRRPAASRGLLVAPVARRRAIALAALRAHRLHPRPPSPGDR